MWEEITTLQHHDHRENQKITTHHHHVGRWKYGETAVIMSYP
jgi:hypothetical protein